MFVLNPDPYSLPSYRIGPFKTDDVGKNSRMPKDDFSVDYFNRRFGQGKWQYTYNGREAIQLALEPYQLQPNDLVTILTTSQNFYISSCVTKTIESVCRWNREIVPETKLIFVNHEFGYPYPGMDKLVATGLPIIEDCCTTFFSQDDLGRMGQYSDFSVFSFPKFFPMQIGGLLVNNANHAVNQSAQLDDNEKEHIQNVLSHYLKKEASILKARKENWDYAIAQFSKLGLTPRFKEDRKAIPSALVLQNNDTIKDLNNLKSFLQQHGVQNSVFYGEDAFFIPVHQSLSREDLDYFFEVIQFFMHN
jgi:dTDP-4-amino-4,6-dideoxygalactose transaminase